VVSGGAITATKGALDNKVTVDIQMVISTNLTAMAGRYAERGCLKRTRMTRITRIFTDNIINNNSTARYFHKITS